MVTDGALVCQRCDGELKYYDSVKRIIITKFRKTKTIIIRRLKCNKCGKLHRELPEFIFPYKHYEYEIIVGVTEGLITCETYGFEDYPCELTMLRWKRSKIKSNN